MSCRRVGGVEVLLYTFVAFVPDGVLRCENLKSCSAAVVSAAATTTTNNNKNNNSSNNNNKNNNNAGLFVEDEEEGGEDSGATAPLSLYLPRQFSLYCRKCFLEALIAKMQSPIKYIILISDKII